MFFWEVVAWGGGGLEGEGGEGGGRGGGGPVIVMQPWQTPVLTLATDDAELATACQQDEIFPGGREGFLDTCLERCYSWPPEGL